MNNTEYKINAGENLNLTLIMIGNPQPNMTVILEEDNMDVLVTEISLHTYKFEVLRVILTEDCGKNLSYEASNDHGTIHQHTILIVDCE